MQFHKNLFFLFILAAMSFSSYGQADVSIQPRSFMLSARLFSRPDERVYYFDKTKAEGLDHIDQKDGHMPKFARSVATDISLADAGTWSTLPDGSRVWRVQVTSPGALALIPCFNDFLLAPGATLHVYTPDKAEVLGAFTASNNPPTGYYNTGMISGETCIIEYYEPAGVAGISHFHINEIGHAYRMAPGIRKSNPGFGEAGSCEVNVKCPEGDNWQDQKNAVVRILVKTGSDYGFCSGALVNNANQDCTPYVLSADHCYQDESNNYVSATTADLAQWVFYFQYESPACTNPTSEGTLANKSMTGCTFAAASLDNGGTSGSDFALLKLNSTPPLSYIPYYAGWSNVNTASGSGVGIHHPSADIKKISTYTTPLQSSSFGGTVQNTHWQVLWAPTASGDGVTEPGSSGSPIFDATMHVVGTLTGGGSSCTSTLSNDYYGKFSYHWTSDGTTTNKQLKPWLDPANTGVQTMTGIYGPCSSTVALDAGISAIVQTGNLCSASQAITCTLENYGSTTLTSDSLTFTIDGGSPQTLVWTGSLSSLQSAQVSLPAQNFSVGMHTITITSSGPNGGTDGNTSNDSRTSTFTIVPASGQYTFYLQTGDQGSDIHWELTDAGNNVLYSGGPYTNNASGQVVNQTWCLPVACYTFSIFSSANDGLAGSNMSGTFNIKNSQGTVVAQPQSINFGAEDSASFCVSYAAGIETVNPLSAISIYPNPSSGVFTISNVQSVTSVTVSDALGRTIKTVSMSSQPTAQIDLSGQESGIYFFHLSSDAGSVVKKVVLTEGK